MALMSMFDPMSMGLGDPMADLMLSGGQSTTASNRRRAAMPADVVETPDSFCMMMDMPGCKQEDIGLEIDGTIVRVNCEYKVPDELQSDKVKWHRAGRPFGAHQRSLRFPESCDMSKVDAKLCNGTLCVTIQKRPESKTHRIQIAGSDAPVAIGSS